MSSNPALRTIDGATDRRSPQERFVTGRDGMMALSRIVFTTLCDTQIITALS